MAGIIKRNPKAFAMAVAMHLALLFFLVFGVDWLEDPKAGSPKVDVVKAKVIDERQVMAEVEKLKKEKQQEKARKLAEKTKAQQELEQIKKEKAAEKKRLAKLKKKRELEARKQALARKKAKAEAERKKREAAEAERRRKAKAEAERKKREAADAERRRKEAAEEKARKEREASMRESMRDEEIRQFSIAVGDKVKRNWLRPPDSGVGLRCKLRVRLSTNGTVLGVQVLQSSGNIAFDRSAEAAVFKSDPLPTPPSGMREITFVFDPEKFR